MPWLHEHLAATRANRATQAAVATPQQTPPVAAAAAAASSSRIRAPTSSSPAMKDATDFPRRYAAAVAASPRLFMPSPPAAASSRSSKQITSSRPRGHTTSSRQSKSARDFAREFAAAAAACSRLGIPVDVAAAAAAAAPSDSSEDEDDEEVRPANYFAAGLGEHDLLQDVTLTKRSAEEILKSVLIDFNEHFAKDDSGVRTVRADGSVRFRLAARGYGDAWNGPEDLWERATAAVKALRRGRHRVPNLKAPSWLASEGLDIQELSDAGRAGMTSTAQKVLRDMGQDPTRLASKAYWMPFVEAGLCIAQQAAAVEDLEALDELRGPKPAGIYLIVGCQGDDVPVMYVGQSNDVSRRTIEHQIVYEDLSIPAREDKRLVYHLLKGCDEVFHFRLASFGDDERAERTMAEGLWCLVFGTYQHKQQWMDLRRRFGLLNVGEQVRGGNATDCFDKPFKARRGAGDGQNGFQDARWQAYKGRNWHLRHLAAKHKAASRDHQADLFLRVIKLSQAGIRAHLGSLLSRGELAYRPASRLGGRIFRAVLNEGFEKALRRDKGKHWFLRLVEGAPNVRTDSILGSDEEDRPLFSGLSLQFRVEGQTDWRVYQPSGGSRGKSPRGFALHLVAFLPPASRERRETAAAAAKAGVTAARAPFAYESLSEMAKMLWDGQATMTTSGQLRIGKLSFRHSRRGDNAPMKKAIVSRIGYDPGERGQIPCRLRGLESRSPKVEIASSSGDWVAFPFRVVFGPVELKAAVNELATAWQASQRGARVRLVDQEKVEYFPELTYDEIHADGTHKEPARKRPVPAPPGRRPGDELPAKAVKRRKLPAPRSLPIRNAATGRVESRPL